MVRKKSSGGHGWLAELTSGDPQNHGLNHLLRHWGGQADFQSCLSSCIPIVSQEDLCCYPSPSKCPIPPEVLAESNHEFSKLRDVAGSPGSSAF